MGLNLETKKSLGAGKREANNDDNNQPNKAGNPKQTVAIDRNLLNYSPKPSPIQFVSCLGGMVPVSDPQTAQKLGWLEPSMSEIHDNNRQIRPENQNMMLQLIEILSTIHPRRAPSSSCSLCWSWYLKNEMRCVEFLLLANRTVSHSIGSPATTTKTKNYASGFRLLVWDMKQKLVAVTAGKEGSAQE
jgi:hypothetical protein